MRRRLSHYTADDARADRARMYGGDPNPSTGRPAGILAHFDGFCWTCDRRIVRGQTRIVGRKDEWVCVGCATVDDE